MLVSKCMTLYFTVLNSLPSVILRSSRSFNFCSNFFLIQLKYWFLIKPAAQQAVLKFDYTLVEVLFPCSHFPSCLCPYAQYNSSYWEGKQNIHLVWDCILIIFKLYLVITAWHSDSLFLGLFSHADTGLGNTLSVLTSFFFVLFSLKIQLSLAFKNPQFISVFLGFLGRGLFTDLSVTWLILICAFQASQFFFNLLIPYKILTAFTGKHKISGASHQFLSLLSPAESHVGTSHHQHSWWLCLSRPSWES